MPDCLGGQAFLCDIFSRSLLRKLVQSHVLHYTKIVDFDILPPTNDFVFKLLFGDDRHKRILIAMLKSFVNLPDEDFELVFLDT